MTEETLSLSKRLVAFMGFRFVNGMRLYKNIRYIRILKIYAGSMSYCYDELDSEIKLINLDDCYPDLEDPATLGCIAKIVQELWGECAHLDSVVGSAHWVVDGVYAQRNYGERIHRGYSIGMGYSLTPQEALVNAIDSYDNLERCFPRII